MMAHTHHGKHFVMKMKVQQQGTSYRWSQFHQLRVFLKNTKELLATEHPDVSSPTRATVSTIPYLALPGSFKSCRRYYNTSSHLIREAERPVKTHYDILNVSSMATTPEIREAFLKLSKECHPDMNKGDSEENHEKFVAINEAYMVLSKPSSRRDYDLTLQVKKHLRQQSNYPAYRAYGYQADEPYYYHRQSHVEWDGTSSGDPDEKVQTGRRIVNFYSLTAFFSIGFVTLVLICKDYILPALPRKTVVKKESDFSHHNFIMTSIHEGQTVHYYAVPDKDNPESARVHAYLKKEIEGRPDEYVLEELNSI